MIRTSRFFRDERCFGIYDLSGVLDKWRDSVILIGSFMCRVYIDCP